MAAVGDLFNPLKAGASPIWHAVERLANTGEARPAKKAKQAPPAQTQAAPAPTPDAGKKKQKPPGPLAQYYMDRYGIDRGKAQSLAHQFNQSKLFPGADQFYDQQRGTGLGAQHFFQQTIAPYLQSMNAQLNSANAAGQKMSANAMADTGDLPPGMREILQTTQPMVQNANYASALAGQEAQNTAPAIDSLLNQLSQTQAQQQRYTQALNKPPAVGTNAAGGFTFNPATGSFG